MFYKFSELQWNGESAVSSCEVIGCTCWEEQWTILPEKVKLCLYAKFSI